MKQIVLLLAAVSILYSHQDSTITWKHYMRGGGVGSESNSGITLYYRLKRTSEFTYRDLRLWGMGLSNNDSFLYLRFKTSRKYHTLQDVYSFSTFSYRQNTRTGLNLQYHINQGLGIFLTSYGNGHINAELGYAADISDYLNNSEKTSYGKAGIFWDHDTRYFSTSLEIETFLQVGDRETSDLSRTLIEFEMMKSFKNGLRLIAGAEKEWYHAGSQLHDLSFSFSLGWKGFLNWNL